MGTTADKINYAINATNDIQQGINNIGGNITQNTELADFKKELDKIYNELPKVTGEGTSIILQNTRKGKLLLTPKGNTEQDAEPTPENPQDIKVVTGINNVKISGINLIDKDNELRQGGTISRSSLDRLSISVKNKLKANTTYALVTNLDLTKFYYAFVLGTVVAPWGVQQQLYDGGWITNINHFTYTTNQECYLNIPIKKIDGSNITPNDVKDYWFMLYEGGYDANIEFEPYIEPVEKELNLSSKNLSEIDRGAHNIPYTANGLTYNFNKNTITVIGTRDSSIGESYIFKKQFKTGSYTISGLPNKEVGNSDRATIYIWYNTTPNAGLSNADETIGNCFGTKTITLSQDGYIGFRIISQGDAVGESLEYNQTYNIQIEEGSTATEYEPYYNYELAKISDYSDLIFKNEITNPYYDNTLVENAWYIHKKISDATITAFANKSGSTANNMYTTNVIQNIQKPNSGNVECPIICTHFVKKSVNVIYSQDILGIGINITGTIGCGFGASSSLTTLELANTWLASNPLDVFFVLDIPDNIEITDTTLIEQLEALNRTIVPSGTIVIETESDSNNAQLIITASALASFENNS